LAGDRSGIETRYSILTEEMLREHPEFYTPGEPSIEQRNALFAEEVPKLAHGAAEQAIAEWGRPATEITHLVVATLTGVAIPGADVVLTKSLGLRPDVNRVMLYMLGCYAGVTALRVAKDLAENNPGSRILICCSELAAPTFRAPNEKYPYDLVGTALFGDGASGVIVGAEPDLAVERPLYEIEWVGEVLAPDSDKIIQGTMKLEGLQFYLDRTLPALVSKYVGSFCAKALESIPSDELPASGTAPGFNDIFWAVHSGGPAILKAVEEAMELEPGKLEASRHILRHYGNISASTVLFVLDELRRRDSPADNQPGCEWGIAVAFGPGVTIEGAVLRRYAAVAQ
jgi:chalcone synthase